MFSISTFSRLSNMYLYLYVFTYTNFFNKNAILIVDLWEFLEILPKILCTFGIAQ